MRKIKRKIKRKSKRRTYELKLNVREFLKDGPWAEAQPGAEAQPDMVNNPSHYGGESNPYETIKVAEAKLTAEEFIGAMKFEVMCYNDRHRRKNGFEDLEKALWYQSRLVDYIKRNQLQESVGR